MDYPQHNETYGRFLRFTKIAIVLLVLLLAGMKYFLV
jgi:Bacterial aa3 type cytochrome c oxidase subunit IV